jgi:hypothetical protein
MKQRVAPAKFSVAKKVADVLQGGYGTVGFGETSCFEHRPSCFCAGRSMRVSQYPRKCGKFLSRPAAPEIVRGQTEQEEDNRSHDVAEADGIVKRENDRIGDDGGRSQNEDQWSHRVAGNAIRDWLAL